MCIRDSIESAIKKHYIEQEGFVHELQKLNAELIKNSKNLRVYDDVKKIYNRYLYELEYDDITFVDEFYNLLDANKKGIVKIVSVSSFKWYVELMIKADANKEAELRVLYIEAMKNYIDTMKDFESGVPSFAMENEISIICEDEELKHYYEQTKNSLVQTNTNDIGTIIATMKEPRRKNGWSPAEEEILNAITLQQHKEWMQESKEYLETCFDFAGWVKGFAGNKPFEVAYKNILEAIKQLAQDSRYKNKLELMVQFFEGGK